MAFQIDVMAHAGDVHLDDLSGVAELLVEAEDAVGDLVGPPANTMPVSRSAARLAGAIPGLPASVARVANMLSSCSR